MSGAQNFNNGLSPLNGTALNLPNVASGPAPVVAITAAVNLGAGVLKNVQSGTTYVITQAGGNYTITLPSVANAGMQLTFIIGTAAAGNTVVADSAGGTTIIGLGICGGAGAVGAGTAHINCNFIGGTALAGDRVQLISNGVNWLALGLSSAAGGITYT